MAFAVHLGVGLRGASVFGILRRDAISQVPGSYAALVLHAEGLSLYTRLSYALQWQADLEATDSERLNACSAV
ncbi:hypothetical protein NDU88_004917 [Pleurodeles waltl]|uniref:Uncharacterized protein n=1 Tax=Pleurodeles waltl TaxID=8319 RepID=A0AAV7T9G6_PLEWA|nr:hypothetical protein NDU88_004917 [Pleurodeles waltl]